MRFRHVEPVVLGVGEDRLSGAVGVAGRGRVPSGRGMSTRHVGLAAGVVGLPVSARAGGRAAGRVVLGAGAARVSAAMGAAVGWAAGVRDQSVFGPGREVRA